MNADAKYDPGSSAAAVTSRARFPAAAREISDSAPLSSSLARRGTAPGACSRMRRGLEA
jgi:hypothetical protein